VLGVRSGPEQLRVEGPHGEDGRGQRAERQVAFMRQESVDQRVIAVYFDRNRRVERLANYGLKDGKIFDFVARTTPTSGREVSYISNLFKAFSFKP